MGMKWLMAGALAGMAVLAGCDKSGSYSTIYQDLARAQEDLANELAAIHDEASMAAARAPLKKLYRRFESIQRKSAGLPKVSLEEMERVQKELAPRLQQAATRWSQEAQRIAKLPGGQDFLETLKNLRQKP